VNKTFVFSNGNYGAKEFYLKRLSEERRFVIAVDGGANFLKKLEVIPDLIVGDMDSIKKEVKNYFQMMKVPFLKYPSSKDELDTELALQWCIEKGYTIISIFGWKGARVDHSIANLYLLDFGYENGVEMVLEDPDSEAFLIDKNVYLDAFIGQRWSILPFGGRAEGIEIKGFEYEVEDRDMYMAHPYGISNRAIKKRVKIGVEKGILLVIRFRKGCNIS